MGSLSCWLHFHRHCVCVLRPTPPRQMVCSRKSESQSFVKKYFRQDDAFELPVLTCPGTVPRTVFCGCRLCDAGGRAPAVFSSKTLFLLRHSRGPSVVRSAPSLRPYWCFQSGGQEVRVGVVPGRCPQSVAVTEVENTEALSKECHPSAVTTGTQLPWGPRGPPASCCFRRTRQGLCQQGSRFAGQDGLKWLPPVLHYTISEGLLSV